MGMKLSFIPLDEANIVQLQQNAELFPTSESDEAFEVKRLVTAVVNQAHLFQKKVKASSPWIGYLVVDAEENEIIGCCGFKGNPTPESEVEIAYYTFPPYEKRGYATQMTKTLTQLALEREEVKIVLAHTLPGNNASARVLEKARFGRTKTVTDPEDNEVWRWERSR